MDERRRRDERVTVRASVRNVHPRAPPSRFHIDREDAVFERGQDAPVEPSAQSARAYAESLRVVLGGDILTFGMEDV